MKLARASLVLFVVITLQMTLFADLTILGVHADVVLLFTIAAAITGGSERGAIAGFAAGLAYDLVLVGTPVGLYALAYCLTGFVVGSLQDGVLRSAWWIPVASAVGASVLGVILFAVIGTVLGEDDLVNPRLLKIAVIVALVNGALIIPALRVARWVLPPDRHAARLSV